MHTTLNKIRKCRPCQDGWKKLLQHLGKTTADDEPIPVLTVLDSNGLDDALWCLRAVDGHEKEMRLYAVWCARQVQHLMVGPHSIAALDVAEKFAEGNATADELTAARAAAVAAAWAAAGAAARAAAWAAVGTAAGTAARDAVRDAVRTAARDAVGAAAWDAAGAAARVAAWAAAWAAARDAQEAKLRQILTEASPSTAGFFN